MKNASIDKTLILFLFFFVFVNGMFSQQGNISKLQIKEIMQGDDFVGHLPNTISWSQNGELIYFYWSPSGYAEDSLFCYHVESKQIVKVQVDTLNDASTSAWVFSKDQSRVLFEKNGDIFLLELQRGKLYQITKTNRREYEPYFICDESKIAFSEGDNIFCWEISTGQIEQMTDFGGSLPVTRNDDLLVDKEKWLQNDQLKIFSVLNKREEESKRNSGNRFKYNSGKPLPIPLNGMEILKAEISPDGNYVCYILYRIQHSKRTMVPDYVTKSGYTETITTRAKVGEKPEEYKMYIYNIQQTKTYEVDFSKLEGINELPTFLQDYPNNKYENKSRIGFIDGPFWNSEGDQAFIDIKANDNKDRWIALLNFENGEAEMLDRQHDDAWIEGPGIGYYSDYKVSRGWMPDDKRIWFQSEESGYSHLYVVDLKTKNKKALTSGKFEVYNPFISKDKQFWYFSSNENHPGVVQFYRMPIDGGKAQQLTNLLGNNEVYLSPDETKLAIRYSYANKPWELYLMENPAISGKENPAIQITKSTTDKFNSYPWRVPEIITFKAGDGKNVYARLYKPADNVKNRAAIIFVHGAGYLQNAHQWWSSYFREYMFHNLLVDNGFTVLDIDYRGSAGYGRDLRTGTYRHMGGKDLTDQVDGAKYLVKNLNIDKERIGIYGGSYGGFITLMAMFKAPETFKAGAAIRSVADWAHYNDGYTSNILNTPINDSIAYYRSSPIYFAEGLKGHLLMLHGMVDDNVHFQDVVRLSQKLIELGKENWDLAIYPVEQHAFIEPSSWIDEYTRIFKFFNNALLDK